MRHGSEAIKSLLPTLGILHHRLARQADSLHKSAQLNILQMNLPNEECDEGFRFFNDSLADSRPLSSPGKANEFLSFPRLPVELRFRIWAECLPLQRYISVGVTDVKITGRPGPGPPSGCSDAAETYTSRNALGNIISGYPYELLVLPFEQWSRALLRVSREANHVFAAFYRLSIPLQPGAFSLLPINPETDILRVRTWQDTGIEALVCFFHDVVAYDPRSVGTVHLAIGHDTFDASHLANLDASKKNTSAVQAIRKLLAKSLQTFYTYISPGADARMMLGTVSAPRAPIQINRSVPIAAQGKSKQSTTFRMLDRDPRPIEKDLVKVYVGTDPRRSVFLWQKFMANFGVPVKTSPMKIRYLQAIWPYAHDHDLPTDMRDGIIEFLQLIDVRWAEWTSSLWEPAWGNRYTEEEDEELKQNVRDVAGLWVFGADAFGEIPEIDPEENVSRHRG